MLNSSKIQALAGVLVCLAVFCSCSEPESSSPPLPEVPIVSLESYPEDLRPRLRDAYEALQERPGDASRNGALAMLFHAHDEHALAETLYRRAAAIAPRDLRWSHYLGVVQSRMGKHTEAAESYRNTLQLDPSFRPARLRLAQTSFELGQIEDSAELYGQLLSANADDPESLYGMGRVFSAQGRPQEAAARLKRAVELSPRFGAAHYALALAYRDLSDEEGSQRHMRLHEQDKLGGPYPNDPLIAAVNALNTSQAELLQRAVDLEQSGNLDASIAEHLRTLEQHPDLTQAHTNLVVLYGRQGKYGEARKHYDAALDIEDRDARLHYNFGVLAFELERYDEAADAFARAIQIDPLYPEAHTNRGHLYEMQGKVDDAVRHYRKAIAAKPAHRTARYHLAQIMLSKRQAQEAIEHLQWTLEPVDEKTPQFYYALAAAHGQLGRHDEARRLAERAKELAKSFGQTELAARIDQVLAQLP